MKIVRYGEDRNCNRAFRSKVWVSNQIGCLLVLWKSGAVWLVVVKRYQGLWLLADQVMSD